MDRRRYLQLLGVGGAGSLAGCSNTTSQSIGPTENGESLTLAAATTTRDSGIMGVLTQGFRRQFGTTVETVARGTGAVLETARSGDCDAVVVHARPLEDAFLRGGHGVNRRALMVNDFMIVGPPGDPAGIAGNGPVDAVELIASAEAPFLSRGDQSGTHLRERRLWREAGMEPGGSWYSETGQGMGQTLVIAEEAEAYTLVDRGTFLNVAGESAAAHVVGGLADPPSLLRNEYAVIAVNPARHDVAYTRAMAFIGYLTGPGQDRIDRFRIGGEQAFRPLARSQTPGFEQYVPSDWTQG